MTKHTDIHKLRREHEAELRSMRMKATVVLGFIAIITVLIVLFT